MKFKGPMTSSEYAQYRRELANFKLATADQLDLTKAGANRVGHISFSPNAKPFTPAFLQRFIQVVPEDIASLSYSIVTTIIGNGNIAAILSEYTTNPITTPSYPYAGAVDSAGNIYWVDRGTAATSNVRRLNVSTNTISSLLDSGTLVSGAMLNTPRGLTRDSAGNIAITDSGNDRLLYYSVVPTTTLYGVSCTQNTWTVIATSLGQPQQLSFAPNGNIYWADLNTASIKKISKSDNGAVTDVMTNLGAARTVYLDPAGNIFIVDTLPALSAVYMLPLVAGTYFGKNIPAAPNTSISAYTGSNNYILFTASGVSLYGAVTDSLGNLYFNSQSDKTVRRIDFNTGVVSVFAGTSGVTGHQDGALLSAKFGNTLAGLFMDSSDNLYVCDTGGGFTYIRKIPYSR